MSKPLHSLRQTLAEDPILGASILGASELVVAINDPDRSTPSGAVVSILQELLPAERVLKAVVSCGTHQHSTGQRQRHEQTHLQGLVHVHWHDAQEPEATRAFVGDAPIIGIGSVEPHYFAGWTGAHKTLTVGLWSRPRIEANHRLAVESGARPARATGNPVFEDLMAQLQAWQRARSGPVRAINLVVEAGGGRVMAAASGEPLESLHAVRPTAEQIYLKRLASPVDRLVATVAPPLDRSLYQALKGVENHGWAVRPGGALLLEARCPDGVGIDHFVSTLKRAPDHRSVLDCLERDGYSLGDHKALRLRRWTDVRGLKLAFISQGLLDEDAELCGARLFRERQSALLWARDVASGPREYSVTDAANRVTLLRNQKGDGTEK